ncbi:MAG: enoyl-CoA hydratase-related protein [Deltaproteobacteria bacterium]
MRALLIISAIFMGLTGRAMAQDVESFYRGKQVRIIVGFSSGGGYDQYGRLLARHISKHIPGVPNVVVQNMPGAASLKSLQYLDAGAAPDGTTIVTFNPGLILGSLTAPQKTPIDFRNFSWIGNISEDVRVCFTWHARGMRDWKAFLARDNVVFGNTGVGTSAYLDDRMLHMLYDGERVSAEHALQAGMIEEIVPHDQLMERVNSFARKIATGPAVAIELTKRLAYRAWESPSLSEHAQYEQYLWTFSRSTSDYVEGRRAFQERRSPNFTGGPVEE